MIKTLTINNFDGSMTIYQDGDINSGRSYVQESGGANPFLKPGNLTWSNAPIQIDSAGSVITDMILAGKQRVESGILYVYAIGHTGRLYKIQVNDPTTYNPDYDNPVLLATLTSGTPTFTRGASIEFYGATEKIYIGHDKGVTTIGFDGAGEAAVAGTWTQTVPRPFKQFVGKLYVGNGANIAEIDTTALVTTSTKLSPGFPANTQVRDMDVTPDGTYLQIVVSRLALFDITSATQDTSSASNSESYIFAWNGTDTGYTSYQTFPSFSLTANTMFQNFQYTFGYDQFGASIYAPAEKILSLPEGPAPLPNAIASTGNLLMFLSPLYYDGVMEADLSVWGSNDFEVGHPLGYWTLMYLNATEPETDIVRVPFLLSVSNTILGSSSNGYTGGVAGVSKFYFSTMETSDSPTTKYRFYKWSPVVTPDVTTDNPIIDPYYQTQNQQFSKKVKVSEVRVYGEPWKTGNKFDISLIGSSGNPMTGGTKTFEVGVNLTAGDDYAWWTPQMAPTYTIGLRVANQGTTNHVISKVEIDYEDAGK